MTSLQPLTISREVIIIVLSAIIELLLLRLGVGSDLLLATLLTVGLIGAFESVLIGGFLGYLILLGPLPRLELIYLLVVPIIIGYFGRRLLGVNIATLCGVVILGFIVFYGLIDIGNLSTALGTWVWSILISLIWVVAVYFYWSSQSSRVV